MAVGICTCNFCLQWKEYMEQHNAEKEYMESGKALVLAIKRAYSAGARLQDIKHAVHKAMSEIDKVWDKIDEDYLDEEDEEE